MKIIEIDAAKRGAILAAIAEWEKSVEIKAQ
jgi:hypothetical protein